MRIPLSWLKDYIAIDMPPGQLAKILTLAGLEVDAIETQSLGCKGVVVAKVTAAQKHPDADNLTVATVTDGEQTFQVVCGAPNCRPGLTTAFAKVDALLTDETGKPFKIKKAKLRGVESYGMLCSAKELGISDDATGIMEFNEHLKPGTELADLYADTILEISLTPNLGYCGSMIGVARELSAATEKPYSLPDVVLEEDMKHAASAAISVEVKNPEGCPNYCCRVIQGVKVGPSPEWLKKRVESAGLRSINNVVDVTNFVLLELGQPLHAFDGDRLNGHKIIVQNAKEGEKFVTLDGKERVLKGEDLMICDSSGPIALAGVMGGMNSEVSDETKNIVLEAAYFCPQSVRRTSKRLGLMTDASKKFERGTDPEMIALAINRAAALIQEVAGGKICKGIVEVKSQAFPKKSIICRLSRVNAILGTQLSESEVENIFNRLECRVSWDREDKFIVEPPSYRNDIKEEIDLVEEVARIYGYNNITRPSARYCSSTIPDSPIFLLEREVRSRLLQEGLQEFLTCDLIGPSLINIVKESEMPESSWVKVVNPTSIEQSVLRTSLLPGLLQVVKYNWDHQVHDVSGFEIGRVHFKDNDQFFEPSVAAIILFGKTRPHHWDRKPHDVDFFDLKGIIQNLLDEMKVGNIRFQETSLPMLHPGRQAAVFSGDLKIGALGEVHPAVQRRLDVPQRIYFAELNLNDLLQVRQKEVAMEPLPVYPGSERDWTLTLDERTPIDDIFKAIDSVRSKYLENVSLVDVYRSDKLGAGIKNVTFRFFYRDPNKTIEQEKVDSEHARIVQNVSNRGAKP